MHMYPVCDCVHDDCLATALTINCAVGGLGDDLGVPGVLLVAQVRPRSVPGAGGDAGVQQGLRVNKQRPYDTRSSRMRPYETISVSSTGGDGDVQQGLRENKQRPCETV